MGIDLFGILKDERVDNDWHRLVDTLEGADWQRESFTTLYEEGNLFIPDVPEAEMSFETKGLLFNVTAFLSERKLYLSIAPVPNSGLKGQLTLITLYEEDLDFWLENVINLPNEVRIDNIHKPITAFLHLFPNSFLDMPVEEEHVSVPIGDSIAIKVIQTPWCTKGPCHEILLNDEEKARLRSMAKLNPPW